jgi:hypothetical protein
MGTAMSQNSVLGRTDWEFYGFKGRIKDLHETTDSSKRVADWHFTADGKLEWLSGEHPYLDKLYTHDNLGRIILEADADTSETWTKTMTTYEKKDKLTIVTTLYLETNKTGISVPPCPLKQTFIYDEKGWLIRSVMYSCDTLTVSMSSDLIHDDAGHLTSMRSVQDSVVTITRYENDKRGNPLTITNFSADGKILPAQTETYTYTYDKDQNWIVQSNTFTRRGKKVTKTNRRSITYYQ